MLQRTFQPLLSLAALAAAGAVALAGIGGADAACLPFDCDCELVRTGAIRQPANAWSSLSLGAAGIWILSLPRLRSLDALVGWAAVASGIFAFWMHASLTTWTARLDGIGVAVLVGAIAVRAGATLIPPRFGIPATAAVVAAGAAAGTTALNVVTLCLGAAGAAAILMHCRRPDLRLAAAGACLLAGGAAAWWLGRSGGPWCDPEGFIWHAAWHVLAAAAVAAITAQLRRCSE